MPCPYILWQPREVSLSQFVICDETIEDAFAIVQRLLGLAYFHCGAENAIQMQVWATWLLYAVLIDLTDAVAEALARPFADLSPAMVYRSLYCVTHAVAQDPTIDPVRYLADHARGHWA